MASAPPAPVLITAFEYHGTNTPLHATLNEAFKVQAEYGGESIAEVRINEPVSELDALLEGRAIWCFCGHGGITFDGEEVLAFGSDVLDVVSRTTLLSIVARHVAKDNLKLVVLTGCKTEEFGRQLRAWTLVECVVCWRTNLNDEAGRIFGQKFAEILQQRVSPRALGKASADMRTSIYKDAFQQARNAVEAHTESRPIFQRGQLCQTMKQQVYQLEDPDASKRSILTSAGVPVLLYDERDALLVLFLKIEGHILRETGGPAGDDRSLPVLTRMTELDLINSTLDETLEVSMNGN